jgi:hypothetical protein
MVPSPMPSDYCGARVAWVPKRNTLRLGARFTLRSSNLRLSDMRIGSKRNQEVICCISFPISCYWPKAPNAGGSGAEPLVVGQRSALLAFSILGCKGLALPL